MAFKLATKYLDQLGLYCRCLYYLRPYLNLYLTLRPPPPPPPYPRPCPYPYPYPPYQN